MGNIKKQRKKFSKPSHPWQKERILAEQEILKEYGLRRKYEIWKMNSVLKNFTSQAKHLITTKTEQSYKERSQLLKKLSSLGLIEANAKIDDVLALKLKNIMDRRLQTLVYKKNMARSLKQARQFIIHRHIVLGDKKITSPSYMVPLNEESTIQFAQVSSFSDPSHPERAIAEKNKGKSKKIEEKHKIDEPKIKIKDNPEPKEQEKEKNPSNKKTKKTEAE